MVEIKVRHKFSNGANVGELAKKSSRDPQPRTYWQRPNVPTKEERSGSARLRITGLKEALDIVKYHYAYDTDPNHTQTAAPLVRALRDLAEAWGEFGNYNKVSLKAIKNKRNCLKRL